MSEKKTETKVDIGEEKSLIDDRPEIYDPKKEPKFKRYEVEIPYKKFTEFSPELQSEIVKQLKDLSKMKNNGIFVPNVEEYTNPFVVSLILFYFIF